ncbi:hypothetical protein TEA_028016 [Camellia sinensis var. sinensis]|uniref:Histidine kinase/HSP90-like ATPase domain-containing protein n=1 Tax=Camellia sinensis var. sinensis TaxID=542762 RepID=A0A4V3WMP6_CAMSN|nr:hypothetical protein TEA_028016 [Camellia sinensis var. sinensis]
MAERRRKRRMHAKNTSTLQPGHRELLVAIHFNEPGWQWSGCFLPDHLGDTQVKMQNHVSGAVTKTVHLYAKQYHSRNADNPGAAIVQGVVVVKLARTDEIQTAVVLHPGRITKDEIKGKKILSIRDRGIGKTKEDLIKNLETIAKFGTLAFEEKMQTSGDLNLIGQFGVGFYSVYLVADYVIVISKHNEDKQYVWQSKADRAFANSKDIWNEPLGHGFVMFGL